MDHQNTQQPSEEFSEFNAFNTKESIDVGNKKAEKKTSSAQNNTDKKPSKIHWLAVVGIAAAVVMVSAAAITATAVYNYNKKFVQYDKKETVFVSESDSLNIQLISNDVIGTGILFEDSDIIAAPEEGAAVVQSLPAGTDLMIYEAVGDYLKVSDSRKLIKGYVLKEKVNTGALDFDEDEKPTDTKKKDESDKITTQTINPATDFPVNSSPYFIYVEKGSHTITIFGKDSEGKYTIPKRTFLTATGRTASLTPVGNFTIIAKERWHCWGQSYSPYCSKYYGGLFFHGPLYKEMNFGTLYPGSVGQIGTNASSGCMRTSVQAAHFIYQFCWVGTNVKIVNGSPLGRRAERPSVDSQYYDPATNTAPVAGIAFDYDNKSIKIGESFNATVKFTPEFASQKDCTWTTSNGNIATIQANEDTCTITGRSAGTAIIEATSVDGGYTASIKVTVIDPNAPVTTEPTVSEVTESTPETTTTTKITSSPTETTKPDTSKTESSSSESSAPESSTTSEPSVESSEPTSPETSADQTEPSSQPVTDTQPDD